MVALDCTEDFNKTINFFNFIYANYPKTIDCTGFPYFDGSL